MAINPFLTVAVASDLAQRWFCFCITHSPRALFWLWCILGVSGWWHLEYCFCWCESVSRFSVWDGNLSFSQTLWVVLFISVVCFWCLPHWPPSPHLFHQPLCLDQLYCPAWTSPITSYVNGVNKKRCWLFAVCVCVRVVCSHTAV